VKPVDTGWHGLVPDAPQAETLLGPMISATLRFADGTSVEREMRTVEGRIPEWHANPVPQHEFTFVGMSNPHRATYFQVGP
jgi:hypothetical protein